MVYIFFFFVRRRRGTIDAHGHSRSIARAVVPVVDGTPGPDSQSRILFEGAHMPPHRVSALRPPAVAHGRRASGLCRLEWSLSDPTRPAEPIVMRHVEAMVLLRQCPPVPSGAISAQAATPPHPNFEAPYSAMADSAPMPPLPVHPTRAHTHKGVGTRQMGEHPRRDSNPQSLD